MTLFIIGISSLIIGTLSGFFIGKHLMKKYISEHSMIDENMVRMMLSSTGQKPSKKKINQIMKSVNKKVS